MSFIHVYACDESWMCAQIYKANKYMLLWLYNYVSKILNFDENPTTLIL